MEGEAVSGNWEEERMRNRSGGMSLAGRLGLGSSWGLPRGAPGGGGQDSTAEWVLCLLRALERAGRLGMGTGAWGINNGGEWEQRRVARPPVESTQRSRRTRTDFMGGSCGQEGVVSVYLRESFIGG